MTNAFCDFVDFHIFKGEANQIICNDISLYFYLCYQGDIIWPASYCGLHYFVSNKIYIKRICISKEKYIKLIALK